MNFVNLLLYIDPATTAIIWQVLVGVFVAFSLALGIWWRKISTFFKGLFVKGFSKKGEEDSDGRHVLEIADTDRAEDIEAKLDSLNDDGVRDIVLHVSAINPEHEYLIDKYGIEFKIRSDDATRDENAGEALEQETGDEA